MILDAAADLVESEGITGMTMERIARHGDVSKSLIYKYFDNVQQLLRELLERELKALRKAQYKAAEEAGTFEQMVRGVTRVYLHYIADKGLLIERLQADPALSESSNPARYDAEVAVEYYARIVNKNFGLPMDTARAVTDISFGVPASAGSYLLRHDMDLDELVEITVSMIIGTINGVRDDYMVRKRILER